MKTKRKPATGRGKKDRTPPESAETRVRARFRGEDASWLAEPDEPAVDDNARVRELIEMECNRLKATLLHKNERYGNAAILPANILSSASPIDGIKVRIDDKLMRLKNVKDRDEDDTVHDLAGYFILWSVAAQVDFEKHIESIIAKMRAERKQNAEEQ